MAMEKPIRSADIIMKDIGGETLLHNSNDKAIHVLNPTAQLIWEMCDGQHTPAEMEQPIRANFSVPDEHDVLGDIQQTLETFTAKGLLLQDESREA